MNTPKVSLRIPFLFLLLHLIDSLDTLAPNDTVKDGDVLISRGRKFSLGFFSPGNSSLRYVVIWYYGLMERTLVWVANRENPVNDTSGVLVFDHYGNVVIREKDGSFTIWSTDVNSTTSNNSTSAQLLDSDNVDQFDCTCLPGFEPKSPSDLYLKDGTGGCKRRQGVSMCQRGEGFVKVKQLKLPDTSTAHVDMGLSLKECEQECLRDCDCTVYSSVNKSMGNMDVSNCTAI
ncbi:hypothetical protein NL676_013049 [Syzygium grande]|nr:hypothetical protein NL676_013049 [Syzygium grande]